MPPPHLKPRKHLGRWKESWQHLDNNSTVLSLIPQILTVKTACANVSWQNSHYMTLRISIHQFLYMSPAVCSGAQSDSVSDVPLDSWGSVHLPSCHHGSHWACVGDTEDDWEQTHCGPWEVSQLARAFCCITGWSICSIFFLWISTQ